MKLFLMIFFWAASAFAAQWSPDLKTFRQQVAGINEVLPLTDALTFATGQVGQSPEWAKFVENEFYPRVMAAVMNPHGAPTGESPVVSVIPTWSEVLEEFDRQVRGETQLDRLKEALVFAEARTNALKAVPCSTWIDWFGRQSSLAERIETITHDRRPLPDRGGSFGVRGGRRRTSGNGRAD